MFKSAQIIRSGLANGFIGLCFLCYATAVQGQDTLVMSPGSTTLEEKIFVHTSKNFYVAGELLWFKLYCVDALLSQPLGMSKLAYVEILDNANRPFLQAKVQMAGGTGDGSFLLPVTLPSGNCKLRAYTNWMKNGSPDKFFEKQITIVNTNKPLPLTSAPRIVRYDVRFFPEGGRLVNNLTSKIGWKLVGSDGKSVEGTGVIKDENNTVVVDFKTLKFGMGSFMFTPVAGHQYSAVITVASGDTINALLPSVDKEGYVVSVTDTTANRVAVYVQANQRNTEKAYLMVSSKNTLIVSANSGLNKGQAIFLVGKDQLRDGISVFTLLNDQRELVCERLYCKPPVKKLQVRSTVSGEQPGLRKKISIDIETHDEKGAPQQAELSMSVFRIDSLQTTGDESIDSYLSLSSDLKGNVESPSWYFSEDNIAMKNAALDNLMLTQGWRMILPKSQAALNDSLAGYLPEYQGHIITGKIINNKNGKPAEGIEGFLSMPSKSTDFYPAKSDTAGMIRFELRNLANADQIIVQTNPLQDDSVYRIDIVNPFIEKYSERRLPPLKIAKEYGNTLKELNLSMQVQSIYNRDQMARFAPLRNDTMAFYQNPDAIYFLEDYTRFNTTEEVLREYVALLNVRNRNDHYELRLFDKSTNKWLQENPLILVDGVPVYDINKFMQYDVTKMRKLEVLNRRYFMGSAVFAGILNWTTYKGNGSDFEPDQHATIIDYDGFQAKRIFYMPVYDSEEKRNDHTPDFRNTLYWTPAIHTDKNGKQQLSFYTSDLPGKYAMVLQGLGADGRAGSMISFFEVN